MPEEWRRIVLIPIYKNKGDAQCCGIKLMSHTMKVWERIIETRLRDIEWRSANSNMDLCQEREPPMPCLL